MPQRSQDPPEVPEASGVTPSSSVQPTPSRRQGAGKSDKPTWKDVDSFWRALAYVLSEDGYTARFVRILYPLLVAAIIAVIVVGLIAVNTPDPLTTLLKVVGPVVGVAGTAAGASYARRRIVRRRQGAPAGQPKKQASSSAPAAHPSQDQLTPPLQLGEPTEGDSRGDQG